MISTPLEQVADPHKLEEELKWGTTKSLPKRCITKSKEKRALKAVFLMFHGLGVLISMSCWTVSSKWSSRRRNPTACGTSCATSV